MTSFMHARNQRYELEMRHAPASVEMIELPRPRDTRDLFDFSGARELIDEAYELAVAALDAHDAQRRARRRTRRTPPPPPRPPRAPPRRGVGRTHLAGASIGVESAQE